MTKDADDLLDLPWAQLAAGFVPLAIAGYAVPAAVAWLQDGTLGLPLFPAAVGTMRVLTAHHLTDPALAYSPAVRTHMPAAGTWWLYAAWLIITAAVAALAAWRRLEPASASARLGRRPYDPRGAHPRSWARARDLRRQPAGISESAHFTLGRLDGRVVHSDDESHVVVVAPTRSGKTTRCVIPWILEHHGPVIVTSTKTDVLDATRETRARQGKVLVYDPFGCGSARWTPLPGCDTWSRALRQSHWFADCAKVGDSEEAEFWGAEAAKLLAPLFHAAALDDRDIADVVSWINTRNHEVPGEILARHQAVDAREQLASVTSLDARGASNLYLTAGSLLHAYRYPEAHAADGAQITPASFLDGGINTLYIVAADQDQRLVSPLVVALISSILHAVALRSREHGPLQPTLRVLLDEAANIAPLRELPRQLSQAAGHGVRIATIWQSLGQLRAHYSSNSDAILANSTAKLFMGPVTDASTRDYVSALLGDERVNETNTTTDAATGLPTSRNLSREARAKAEPAALQQLTGDRALLFNGAKLPAVVGLYPWWSARR